MTRDAKLVDRTLRELGLKKWCPRATSRSATGRWSPRRRRVARYHAARDWFDDARPHLVISSGPYLLDRYDPAAQYAELIAFRDPSYPFTAADFQLGDATHAGHRRPRSSDLVGLGAGCRHPGDRGGSRHARRCATCSSTRPPGRSWSRGDATPVRRLAPFDGDHRCGRDGHACSRACTSWTWPRRAMQVALITERQVDLEVTP